MTLFGGLDRHVFSSSSSSSLSRSDWHVQKGLEEKKEADVYPSLSLSMRHIWFVCGSIIVQNKEWHLRNQW